MAGYDVKPLSKDSWPDLARLVERHNGVWGGCWCMEFHPAPAAGVRTSRWPLPHEQPVLLAALLNE